MPRMADHPGVFDATRLRAEAMLAVTVDENPYIPVEPTAKQARLLACPKKEALYGGAAGGGKSAGLLMAALQYAEVPGYDALLLRRTFRDLAQPGALVDLAHDWLDPTPARWHEQAKRWQFPSGASLTFGYMDGPQDHLQYQGGQFAFVGFDELTQFTERQYEYLFSRVRRKSSAAWLPVRVFGASNPGGPGHDWVKARFVEGEHEDREFIFAVLDDNPHLDRDEYRAMLARLDPITRAQLQHGDWDATPEGGMFRREWFPVVGAAPADAENAVRYWDCAATAGGGDWTAGVCVAEKGGVYWVLDVRHIQATPQGVEAAMRQCAAMDGYGVRIGIEQEPGASGKGWVSHCQREVLTGYAVSSDNPTGSKIVRAQPLAAAAEAGNVRLVKGPWNAGLLDELASFPTGAHDDQVDALAGAQKMLANRAEAFVV